MATYRFEQLLTADGWRRDVALTVDEAGYITGIEDGAVVRQAEEVVRGAALPGLCNAHSHAFQRAMAGQAEWRGASDDSFWTWRERMYDLALRVSPDDLRAIASFLYVDMLKAGYTQVCEFHYLHHDIGGAPYAPPVAMSDAIFDAAHTAGIGLTHLPTLYMTADFGAVPASERQRRFLHTTDAFLNLLQSIDANAVDMPETSVGVAFHSLRAVPPEALRTVLESIGDRPIHIHVAEQQREVEACLASTGLRPVEWLLRNAPVGPAWNLVHATHLSDGETAELAATGAVAVLCPTTEANLGDGIFPLAPYLAAGGNISIGSDSHVSVSAIEELRWLEYGQRLKHEKRNVAASPDDPHTGARLWRLAAAGGGQSAGVAMGALAVGQRADLVVIDSDSPLFVGLQDDSLLDAAVFAGNPAMIRHVMVAGHWRVREGWHPAQADVEHGYRQAMLRLLSA